MARKTQRTNPDPLTPARSRADWDAQGWSSESEPLTAAPRLESTISIRFDPDSALLLRRAARLSGHTKSEFVRRATMREAEAVVQRMQSPITVQSVTKPPAITTGSSARTLPSNPSGTATSGALAEVV